jgi:cytidine deaminase
MASDEAGEPDATDDELLAAARAVAERAYGRYSDVRVGAALLASDGRVFAGCNVENASYGLTICAERAAVAAAVAAGARDFTALALTSNQQRPLVPCGACRQVLHEFAPALRVIVAAGDERLETTLGELLPRAFGPDDLA